MKRLWWLLVPALALAGFWSLRRSPPPPALPSWATAPAGSDLPDGFQVPDGALRLGPVLRPGPETDWTAILAVTGDPLEVWEKVLGQLAERFPAAPVDPGTRRGCRTHDEEGFGCEISLRSTEPEGTVVAAATLLSARDDVTGRYLVVVESTRYPTALDYLQVLPEEWQGGSAPAPEPARSAPRAGEPLAPSTTAYDGDEERYVVIEGSALLAQWGVGSLTGGFEVLLAVPPGADPETVGQAYARQAAQYEGQTKVERYNSGNTRYIHYMPPGGAGGYQGNVWVVDPPDETGFIFYSLFND